MKKLNVKAGLYIRLSREDGDNLESESIVNQRGLLQDFVKKNNFLVIDEYVDDGYTGSNFSRPAWKRLINDLTNSKINTIITKDLSRMGRDYISMGEYIERIFPEKGIRYIAINDDIDTLYETPGLEFLQFKLMFNDYFLKDTSKKIRKIIKNKKENGQFLGWKAPYGYKKDPMNKHKLIVDNQVKPIIKQIFTMALQGKSLKQIAYILTQNNIPTPSMYAGLKNNISNQWCSRTIKEILTNETYIGNLIQGKRKKINYKSSKEIRTSKEDWIIIPNNHEAIIDKPTFSIIQQRFSQKVYITSTKNYLLSGLLRCKECGHAIGINQSRDKKRLYCHCTYYTANSKYHLCTPHCLNYYKLEQTILEQINQILKNVNYQVIEKKLNKYKNSFQNQSQKHINKLKKKIRINNLYIERIYEDRLKGNISIEMFKRLSKKYQDEIHDCSINIQKIDTYKQEELNLKKYINPQNPVFLKNIIDKILISEDKTIEIYYKFSFNNETKFSHDVLK